MTLSLAPLSRRTLLLSLLVFLVLSLLALTFGAAHGLPFLSVPPLAAHPLAAGPGLPPLCPAFVLKDRLFAAPPCKTQAVRHQLMMAASLVRKEWSISHERRAAFSERIPQGASTGSEHRAQNTIRQTQLSKLILSEEDKGT
jgi:hypothetical protein